MRAGCPWRRRSGAAETIASLRGVLARPVGSQSPDESTTASLRRLATSIAPTRDEIALTHEHNQPPLKALATGEIDVGVVGPRPAAPPDVRARVVAVEPLVLRLPRGHPPAAVGISWSRCARSR